MWFIVTVLAVAVRVMPVPFLISIVLATLPSNEYRSVLAVVPVLNLRINDCATDPACPVVFWLSVGISEATIALNDGVPFAAFGAAKKYFCV